MKVGFAKGDKAMFKGVEVTILGTNGISPNIYEITAGDGDWTCCADEDLEPLTPPPKAEEE